MIDRAILLLVCGLALAGPVLAETQPAPKSYKRASTDPRLAEFLAASGPVTVFVAHGVSTDPSTGTTSTFWASWPDSTVAHVSPSGSSPSASVTISVTSSQYDMLVGNLEAMTPTEDPKVVAGRFLRDHGQVLGLPAGFDLNQALADGTMKLVEKEELQALGVPGQAGPKIAVNQLKIAPAVNKIPWVARSLVLGFNRSRTHLVSVRCPRGFRKIQPSEVSLAGFGSKEAVKKALEFIWKQSPGARLGGDGAVHQYLEQAATGAFEHRFRVELAVGSPVQPFRVTIDQNGQTVAGANDLAGPSADHVELGGYGVPDGNVLTVYCSDALSVQPMTNLMPPPFERDGWMLQGTDSLHPRYFISRPGSVASYISPDGHFNKPRLIEFNLKVFFAEFHWVFPNPHFHEYNAYYQFEKAREQIATWGFDEVNQYQLYYDTSPTFPFKGYPYVAWFSPPNTMHFPPYWPHKGWSFVPEDSSVLWHEYGHAVLSMLNPNWNAGADSRSELLRAEPLVIAEGFADFLACCLTKRNSVGEQWFGPDVTGGVGHSIGPLAPEEAFAPLRRNIADDAPHTQIYPDWVWKYVHEKKVQSRIFGPHDTPNVWMASKVFSGMCWDIREQIKQTDNVGNDEAIARAATLVLMAARICGGPVTFENMKFAILMADLFLYDGRHIDDFFKAEGVFDRRGLGA